MNHIQILAMATSVKVMLDKGWMDICVIDQILRMAGTIPNKRDYDTLRLLHCVSFKDMPPELQESLPSLIKSVLSGPTISVMDCLPPCDLNQSRKISFIH